MRASYTHASREKCTRSRQKQPEARRIARGTRTTCEIWDEDGSPIHSTTIMASLLRSLTGAARRNLFPSLLNPSYPR